MITIKKDGEPFDLGDIRMTFRLRSPLWNDIPSHTFSFDLDATDRNLRLTGYLHRPSAHLKQSTDMAVLCNIHGWILGATMRVENAAEKTIRCHLAIDNGQMNIDWGNQYLDEMDFPTIIRNGGVSQIMNYNKDKTSNEVACQFPPVKIPEYFGKEEADDALGYTGWINSFDPEIGQYDFPTVNQSSGKVLVPTVSVPMFYLRWILHQIMELNGLKLDPRFMSSGPLKEMLVFNNRCCEEKRRRDYFRATKTTPQTYPDRRILIFNNETTPPNTDDNNSYNPATGQVTIRNAGIHELTVGITVEAAEGYGFLYLIIDGYSHILSQGFNLVKHTHYYSSARIGYTYYCEVYCYYNEIDPNPPYGYIEHPLPVTVNAGSYVAGRNASLSDLPGLYFDGAITPALHMPHVKIKELLTWLRDGFAMAGIFSASAREFRFVLLADILKRPASGELGNIETDAEYSPDQLNGIAYAFDVSGDDAPVTEEITGLEFLGNFATTYELPMPENSSYYAYVYTVGKFYVYAWNETSSRYEWQPMTDYLKPLTTGQGELEMKPAWHPPAHFFEGDIYGTTPWIGCKGSSPFFKVGINKTPLVMMLFHGLQPAMLSVDDQVQLFPCASGLGYNSQGGVVSALELSWTGLREAFFSDLEAFYANRWMLEGRRQIDAAFLKQLTWDESYLHKGREYLLDSVEFTATQLGFTAAKITAWRKG
jgi:hypothetical protein